MFKNRVQIGRLGGVDGLVGNAGNLEFVNIIIIAGVPLTGA